MTDIDIHSPGPILRVTVREPAEIPCFSLSMRWEDQEITLYVRNQQEISDLGEAILDALDRHLEAKDQGSVDAPLSVTDVPKCVDCGRAPGYCKCPPRDLHGNPIPF